MTDNEENLFPVFHKYNKLVRRNLVKPLLCQCGEPAITALGDDDELVLNCFSCGAITTPGIDTIDNVKAVVSEHFIDGEE